MERSTVLEKNHFKSNSSALSKPEGSFIQIESISIDLVSAKDKSDAGKCEHFSIRGYVSEIRRKDRKMCCPFSIELDRTGSEDQTSSLAPLDVPKFRWWRCQNCLTEVAAKGAAENYVPPFNCCSANCSSISNCAHIQSAAVLLSDVQQAPKSVHDGPSVDANASTKLSNDNHLLSCGDKREKKAEVAHRTVIEENLHREIQKVTSAAPEVDSGMIKERHTHSTVVLKSKCNGSKEFDEPGSGSHGVADVGLVDGNLKCIVKESDLHCPTETQTSSDDQHLELTKGYQTLGLGTMVAEASQSSKAHTTRHPSLELDEFDYEASESAQIMVGNDLVDHPVDKSSNLHRRKTRKVRLLTELLGENGDAKSDHVETDNSLFNRNPDDAFGRLDGFSVPQGQVAIQGNVKRGSSQNRKRKLPPDEEWRPPQTPSPDNSSKRAQTWKEDTEPTEAIVGKGSRDAIAGIGLKNDMKTHPNKDISDRSSTIGKKKNKKVQALDAFLSLAPPKVNVHKEIQDTIGNISESNAADSLSFGLAHDAFTGRGIDGLPFPFLPLRTERRPNMCQKKNKNPQVDGGQASLFPWTNWVHRNDSITQKNADIMQTGSVTVPFQSEQDRSTEKGLHLSLNSFWGVQTYDKEFIPPVENGLASLLPWQEVTSKADQLMRKNTESNNVGVPSKSPPAGFFGKSVNYEESNKITTFRMPFLNDRPNCISQVEEGGCSQIHRRDCSGASNMEKSFKAKEHSAVEQRHGDRKADKVFEQGASDDIPMEIVELMAKNQYERCLPDIENKEMLETSSSTRNCQMMDCAHPYSSGEWRLLREEIAPKQKSPQGRSGRNGIITTEKNVGPAKKKSVDFFSHIDRNHLNMSHLDQTQAPTGFRAFAQSQKKASSGAQFSATGSNRHSGHQDCKWNAGIEHGPSRTCLQTLGGYNTLQTVPQQSEAAAHLWSTMIPNQMPFGCNMPQKGVAQSTNIAMLSQRPDPVHDGNMNSNRDPKFLNLNATSHEKHNMHCCSETLGRTNAEYPLACKHNEMGLPQNLLGSLDLYANETIPAMHLLSLMDAGMRSGPTFNIVGAPKFPKRPSFPHDHRPKEFPRMEIGAYKTVDSMKQQLPEYCGRNQFSEKANGCFHCIPTVGASASSFQSDKDFQRASDFTGQVCLPSREIDKIRSCNSAIQIKGRRSEKFVFTTGSLGTNHGAIPVHSVQKRFLGVSDSSAFTSQYNGMESSAQHLESSSMHEICSVNKNPADFILPGAASMYMIRGEDLKLGKVTPQTRHGLIKLDGRKRQRNLKHATVKERMLH